MNEINKSNENLHSVNHDIKGLIRRQKMIFEEINLLIQNNCNIDNKSVVKRDELIGEKYVMDMEQTIVELNNKWIDYKNLLKAEGVL
ncbi:MAG: hypothetical protein HQK49_09035 [Oligoflexia bacterium]|nr:hypothetical protein [Oligoflexia bacterium]